jgi:plasmid maintenance system antidote protein VapI
MKRRGPKPDAHRAGEILEKALACYSNQEAADALGVSRERVRQVLKQHGWHRPYRGKPVRI